MRMMRKERMRYARYGAFVKETRNIHNVIKLEAKQLLERTRHGWMMLHFMDGADWILTTLGHAQ